VLPVVIAPHAQNDATFWLQNLFSQEKYLYVQKERKRYHVYIQNYLYKRVKKRELFAPISSRQELIFAHDVATLCD